MRLHDRVESLQECISFQETDFESTNSSQSTSSSGRSLVPFWFALEMMILMMFFAPLPHPAGTNGMMEPWFESKGLGDADQVLAYFAVSKLGEPPTDGKTDTNPEGLTAAYGKWASVVAARLHAGGLSCKCCLLFSMMSPEIVGKKFEPERLYDSVNVLLSLPSKNGGLAAWEPAGAQEWLELLNPTEFFQDIVIEHE